MSIDQPTPASPHLARRIGAAVLFVVVGLAVLLGASKLAMLNVVGGVTLGDVEVPPMSILELEQEVYGWRPAGGGFDRAVDELDKRGEVEVLALGSSLTQRAFDPRVFAAAGVTAHSLPLNATYQLHLYELLRAYVSHPGLRVLLIEAAPDDASREPTRATINFICAGGKVSPWTGLRVALELRGFAATRVAIFTVLGLYPRKDFGGNLDGVNLAGGCTYLGDGYCGGTRKPLKKLGPSEEELLPSASELEYLARSIDFAKSHGLQVIVHVPPVSFQPKSTSWDARIAEFSQVAKTHGAAFFDGNTIPGEPFTAVDFSDEEHMRIDGARRYSELLLRFAREVGYVRPSR